MKNRSIRRICVVDTVYTLFLYLLISSETELSDTFYFFSDGIPIEIRKHFKNSHYFDSYKCKRMSYRRFCLILRILSRLRWPFLFKTNLSFWGHSHTIYSSGIIGNRNFNMIEDGTANYTTFNVPSTHKYEWLKRQLFGNFSLRERIWGENSKCSNIYLTGLLEINDAIAHKVKLIDTKSLWNNLSESKKCSILKIFDITDYDIEFFQRGADLLLTQCFSEDGHMSENAKITMYKEVVTKYCNINNLIIKSHPREKTDYSLVFPGVFIYQKRIPIEVLALIGIQLRNIITVNSTAAYSIKCNTGDVIVCDDLFNKYMHC